MTCPDVRLDFVGFCLIQTAGVVDVGVNDNSSLNLLCPFSRTACSQQSKNFAADSQCFASAGMVSLVLHRHCAEVIGGMLGVPLG